jgi:putative two-component system response regulator
VVRARLKSHLSLANALELKQTRLQVIQRLSRAAAYKDHETGLHILRMNHSAQVMALEHHIV